MYQRQTRMKQPMQVFDDPMIRMSSLIKFVDTACKELEFRGEVDSALCFECLRDYLEQDYKPGTPFAFTGHAIGL